MLCVFYVFAAGDRGFDILGLGAVTPGMIADKPERKLEWCVPCVVHVGKLDWPNCACPKSISLLCCFDGDRDCYGDRYVTRTSFCRFCVLLVHVR